MEENQTLENSTPCQWSQYHTVLIGTAGIFRTSTLTGTKTRLFRTDFCTGAYRVVLEKPGKKSDTGRKKDTGW